MHTCKSITSSVGFALASTVKVNYDCNNKGVRLRYEKHESVRLCMKVGDWWRWCCSTLAGSGIVAMGGGVSWSGIDSIVHVLVCVILVALFADFWWASGHLPTFHWVNRWCCCGYVLTLPFRSSFWSIEYNYQITRTSGFSWHTPSVDMTEWVWLDILHLTDVFQVVYFVLLHPSRSVAP